MDNMVDCHGGSKAILKLGFLAQRFFNVGGYFQIGIGTHLKTFSVVLVCDLSVIGG